jgi:hypothetical protein
MLALNPAACALAVLSVPFNKQYGAAANVFRAVTLPCRAMTFLDGAWHLLVADDTACFCVGSRLCMRVCMLCECFFYCKLFGNLVLREFL